MANKNQIIIELLKVYQAYAEQINISANISKVLHEISDIKSSGNEIEIALRNVFSELLAKKYHVGHGHIVDKSLNVSKQYDFMITEWVENKSILKTKDTTELFFYETVYSIGEVKATWNVASLKSTIESIRNLKSRLARNAINNKTIISASAEIQLASEVTNNPIRNPIFSFGFAIKEDKDFNKIQSIYTSGTNWADLPNIVVILNKGVFVLLKEDNIEEGKVSLSLYPEFVEDKSKYNWKFIENDNPGRNLAYLLFCIQEHLIKTVLEQPPYLMYSSSILEVDDDNILNLDEL